MTVQNVLFVILRRTPHPSQSEPKNLITAVIPEGAYRFENRGDR